MRIAQVAPLFESVPPRKYGGTERVVSYLTEELVAEGHEVTLFASGDSHTRAKLIHSGDKSLRMHSGYDFSIAPHLVMLEELRRHEQEFDVIHFHTEALHLPYARVFTTPTLTTLHGRLDFPLYASLYREFGDLPFVSISNSQRASLGDLNWRDTIYHGLPETLYRFGKGGGNYAAFLGRMSREKRPDRAIEITRLAGVPLKIAAKRDSLDGDYFDAEIKPLIDRSPHVEFIGEIGEAEKNEFLGSASALLFPIDWPEPFGLVMIESMACGTPVIAFRRGAAPEIIDEGVTGHIVDTVEAAAESLSRIDQLDRLHCRRTFETRFSVRSAVRSYLSVYQGLLSEETRRGNSRWTTSFKSATRST